MFGLGVGITAYTLGLRHAFDADHIGAIDNTTRKLMSRGPAAAERRLLLLARPLDDRLRARRARRRRRARAERRGRDDGSALHQATGLVGPVVSGTFLLLIGLLNLVDPASASCGSSGACARATSTRPSSRTSSTGAGSMNRFYGRATRAVRKPWQMYPLGLPVRARASTPRPRSRCSCSPAARPASGLPFYAILCLPILFAAGMSLLDTIDGAFMNFAYGWAFSRPVRKIFYNITITGLSVAVALVIGTIELLSVLADRLSLDGGVWDSSRRRPQPRRLRDRRAVRADLGARARRSGASGTSRSAGAPS